MSKKVSIRLTDEQYDFLTQDGGKVSEGVKESIDLIMLMAKSPTPKQKEVKIEANNESIPAERPTSINNNLNWS